MIVWLNHKKAGSLEKRFSDDDHLTISGIDLMIPSEVVSQRRLLPFPKFVLVSRFPSEDMHQLVVTLLMLGRYLWNSTTSERETMSWDTVVEKGIVVGSATQPWNPTLAFSKI